MAYVILHSLFLVGLATYVTLAPQLLINERTSELIINRTIKVVVCSMIFLTPPLMSYDTSMVGTSHYETTRFIMTTIAIATIPFMYLSHITLTSPQYWKHYQYISILVILYVTVEINLQNQGTLPIWGGGEIIQLTAMISIMMYNVITFIVVRHTRNSIPYLWLYTAYAHRCLSVNTYIIAWWIIITLIDSQFVKYLNWGG